MCKISFLDCFAEQTKAHNGYTLFNPLTSCIIMLCTLPFFVRIYNGMPKRNVVIRGPLTQG